MSHAAGVTSGRASTLGGAGCGKKDDRVQRRVTAAPYEELKAALGCPGAVHLCPGIDLIVEQQPAIA